MTDQPGENPSDGTFDAELHGVRRSYIALAFAAVLVVALVWLVKAIRENNRIVECMTSGHHNCVPLDTSVKGPAR
jgi:hypothetical protein